MTPWVLLFIAGLFEMGWALGIKYANGFTRPWPTAFTVVSLIASMAFLGIAVRTLPLGTAYAIWTGIGTVGIAIAGIFLFQEPATALRIGFIALIVVGILGLKLTA